MRFKYEMISKEDVAYVDVNKAYLAADDEDFFILLTKILQDIWNENGGFEDMENWGWSE